MAIYGISDLHLANKVNQQALIDLPIHHCDWLLLAGDIGETTDHLRFALSVLNSKFKKIIWTPGNHDLWTFPLNGNRLKGVEKYQRLVALCHQFGVYTPEDQYQIYQAGTQNYCVAPLMTLYDYSFKPNDVENGKEIQWAQETGVLCADEELLFPYPYKSISDWCYERCLYTEDRLNSVPEDVPLILINHYPLIKELGRIFTYPRFSIWCGTILTERWLDEFNIGAIVFGHLHIRSSKVIEGIRHEEVSFGYPYQWDQNLNIACYLKKIVD